MRLSDVVEGERYAMRVDDNSLARPGFWADYREDNAIDDSDGASLVTFRRTDRYRGLAFLIFRFFAMRRELARLKEWAETGRSRAAACSSGRSRRSALPCCRR